MVFKRIELLMQLANSSNGSDDCFSEDKKNLFTHTVLGVQLLFAFLILVILSFTQKRRKFKRDCLWGVPGIPVPVDFLVTPQYRTIYTIIFGVMATSIIRVFQQFSAPEGLDLFALTFYKILVQPLILLIVLSLTYFPLFACVKAPRPWLGRVLGLLYSVLWFTQLFVLILVSYIPTICEPDKDPVLATSIITDIAFNAPVVVGALLVVGWYLYKVMWGVTRLCRGSGRMGGDEEMTESAEELRTSRAGQYVRLGGVKRVVHGVKHYHLLHVKTLLKKPELRFVRVSMPRKIVKKLKDYFFPFQRGFRFPLPFLGAVVAMSVLLYQLTIQVIIGGISLTTILPKSFNSQLAPLLHNLSVLTNHSLFIDEITEVATIMFVGLPALVCVSPVISFLICLFLLVHMVSSVSKECKRVAKEGFNIPLPSPGYRVPASWKYIGYQIGFFVLAYSIYTALVFIAGIVCSVVYFGFRFLPRFTTQVLLYFIVPVVWSQLVFLGQNILCRLIFIEDKRGKFIALTNRRLFNWFSFLLFFYNGFAGFVNAILRTLMASVFTLLLLFRLDRVVLMKGFERFDFGHKAYLGFMYLDYTYNNAVVHVFLGLLRHSLREHLLESAGSVLSDDGGGEGRRRSPCKNTNVQARNRWLVAYTLLKNPSLVKHTAANIQQTRAAKASCSDLELPSLSSNPNIQFRH